jgi:hypothetical protein
MIKLVPLKQFPWFNLSLSILQLEVDVLFLLVVIRTIEDDLDILGKGEMSL